MKDKTFDYIWTNIISKAIESVAAKNVGSASIECHFVARKESQLKKAILKDYLYIRDVIKKNYYSNDENGSENGDGLIDNHKIAACICWSVLKNKPFKFELRENMPVEMYVSNYEVAYTASVGFIYCMLIAQYRFNGYTKFAEQLEKNGRLLVPKTSLSHDGYSVGRIHALALNDMYGNQFDLLAYADMMFWIEFYNRQLIEGAFNPVQLYDGEKIHEEK